jgi:hypothetical protein
VTDCTHAYVGYDRDGTPIMLLVDDASRHCAEDCARIIRAGGRIERMTIDQARRVDLFKRPEPKAP